MTREEKYIQCEKVGTKVLDLVKQVDDIVVFKAIIAASIENWSENHHLDYGEVIDDIATVMIEKRLEEGLNGVE